MITGSNDIERAKIIYHQMSSLVAKGGFTLRKWISNSRELMQSIYPKSHQNTMIVFNDALSIKTLGLMWCPTRDLFQFKVHLDNRTSHTKRSLLSESSRIFDPLGWLSPILVVIKMIFQRLWVSKVQWDEALPPDINVDWSKLRSQLVKLEDVEVPRCTIPRLPNTQHCSKQLHVFTDASEKAYGAVAYLRTANQINSIGIRIVLAKSKIAPIKQLSLPRLELCAALLGSQLIKFVKHACQPDVFEVYAWTDSMIVLSWLTPSSRKRECFVANRVTKILHEIPRTRWSHVPSNQNPADIVSRGLSPATLYNNELWWQGPDWLSKSEEYWPIRNPREIELPQIMEPQPSIQVHHTSSYVPICDNLFTKFNNVLKIKRILGYTWKYIQNLRMGSQLRSQKSQLKKSYALLCKSRTHIAERIASTSSLGVDALNWAERCYIKWAQAEFNQDVTDIQRTGHVSDSSNLLLLTPFLDEYGVLRVGGRLENTSCSFETKHPAILPKGHILNRYLIDEYHNRYFHAGAVLMTALLRQRFWILGCRRLVRSYLVKCITCFKNKQHQNSRLMGNLPKFRVHASRPFQYTGVDYAGPIFIRSREGRGRCKVVKGYIALFICMVVKAVHIELVTDMSTASFIAALRRCIARRGLPVEVISDNGTNFGGCKKELGELFRLFSNEDHFKLINEFLSPQKISFRFIPARSPHFGGIWEANIKSMKQHLNKAVGSTTLTYEQLNTLLTEIEALLNSRPLCAVSEDVNDFNALTPGHFLVCAPLVALPEPDLQHLNQSRLSMWQNLQVRVKSFWTRWSLDYLTTLQYRPKWKHKQLNLEVGQLVLIREDNLPKSTWLLGRVTAIHKSPQDNLVRVVTVKTINGEYKRPIVKVVPLPLADEEGNGNSG